MQPVPEQSPPLPHPAKRSAYVIFHAGEVYSRDCVRWYSPRYVGEKEKFYREYHNIGDSVVYDSTLKILGFDSVVPVDFNKPDPEALECIRATCSHGILRGSNYFHPEMEWGKLIEFVRRMGLPLVVLGVGVQAPLGRLAFMGESSARVAQALGDYCVCLGVRGERSAEMFADVGVKNVRIVGCPSMFRSLRPEWNQRGLESDNLPEKPIRAVRSSVTLRREVGPDYVADIDGYLATERKFIFDAAASTDMTLFAQGELFEKYFFDGRQDLLVSEWNEPVEQGWISGADDPMVQIYKSSLFFSEDVTHFCEVLSQSNFVTGFRVHGVLPALEMGIPGALVNYDMRTDELIKTFDIPFVPIHGCTFQATYNKIRNFDYTRMTKRYAQVRAEVIAYLEQNAIPHRMTNSN